MWKPVLLRSSVLIFADVRMSYECNPFSLKALWRPHCDFGIVSLQLSCLSAKWRDWFMTSELINSINMTLHDGASLCNHLLDQPAVSSWGKLKNYVFVAALKSLNVIVVDVITQTQLQMRDDSFRFLWAQQSKDKCIAVPVPSCQTVWLLVLWV